MLIEERVTYPEMTAAEQLRPGRRPPAPVEMVKLDQAAAAGLRRTHAQIAAPLNWSWGAIMPYTTQRSETTSKSLISLWEARSGLKMGLVAR